MKSLLTLFLLVLVIIPLFAFGQENVIYPNKGERLVDYGIGLGSALAISISWSRNKSVVLAIIHAIFGWLYIIYYLITRKHKAEGKG